MPAFLDDAVADVHVDKEGGGGGGGGGESKSKEGLAEFWKPYQEVLHTLFVRYSGNVVTTCTSLWMLGQALRAPSFGHLAACLMIVVSYMNYAREEQVRLLAVLSPAILMN
jgi:hypothetical protein